MVDVSDLSIERVLKRLKKTTGPRRERFTQEVEAIKRLEHPNIIKLIDADLEGDEPYFVTEYCAGGSLEDVPVDDVPDDLLREWFLQIADAVEAVHSAGHVHRDIKPANIFLRSSAGPAVLGDFGLVYTDGQDRLTMTHEQVGSRFFMAPELRDGRAKEVTAAADIYALGKVLYWLFSGKSIFDRENHREGDNHLVGIRDDRALEYVHVLLDSMITFEPSGRLNADAVIESAEKMWYLMNGNFNPVNVPEQECRYCGRGQYQVMSEDGWFTLGIKKEQVNKHNFRVLVCSFCGHLQYFWAAGSKAGDWITAAKVPFRR